MSFSPDILNSQVEVKNYFNDPAPFDAVRELKNEAPQSHLFGTGRKVWILTKTPFVYLLSLFFRAVAWTLNVICLSSLSMRCKILAAHLMRDNYQLDIQEDEGNRLLVHSINLPQRGSTDTYTRGSIPVSAIADERIRRMHDSGVLSDEALTNGLTEFYRKLKIDSPDLKPLKRLYREKGYGALENKLKTYYNDEETFDILYYLLTQVTNRRINYGVNDVKFYRPDGTCRGACDWFAALYLHTEADFENPEAHAIAVARQFTKGFPSQAAILQTFTKAHKLMGLKAEKQNFDNYIYSRELDYKSQLAAKKIEKLVNGLYLIGTPNHRMLWINGKTQQYLWDINRGLLKIKKGELLGEMQGYLFPGHHKNFLFFERYSLRSS